MHASRMQRVRRELTWLVGYSTLPTSRLLGPWVDTPPYVAETLASAVPQLHLAAHSPSSSHVCAWGLRHKRLRLASPWAGTGWVAPCLPARPTRAMHWIEVDSKHNPCWQAGG